MDNEFTKDIFLDGNELVEEAISKYCTDPGQETMADVMDVLRKRIHADGHFIFPVIVNEEDEDMASFRIITDQKGKSWYVAFTSQAESEKGHPSQTISYFIGDAFKICIKNPDVEGYVINPWGEAFFVTKETIRWIFKADNGVEYTVPDEPITAELLEDGSYLKRVIGICNRNRTEMNLLKLLRILRDSDIWIPCNVVMSERDEAAWNKTVKDASEGPGLDSLTGHTLISQDPIRMIPDILQSGDQYFFPVFTSEEEMGEYGEHFSKVGRAFVQAMVLAENNEKDLAGIVINAFTEPFVVNKEIFNIIKGMESSLE